MTCSMSEISHFVWDKGAWYGENVKGQMKADEYPLFRYAAKLDSDSALMANPTRKTCGV